MVWREVSRRPLRLLLSAIGISFATGLVVVGRSMWDAIEFMMAGATAIAVGTANFYQPQTALHVITGLCAFMERKKLQDVRELIGTVQIAK